MNSSSTTTTIQDKEIFTMNNSSSTTTTIQDKEIFTMNNSSSTTTRTRGVNKIGFLFALMFVILVFIATPLTAFACDGNNDNNNNNNNNNNKTIKKIANAINNKNNSCTLVDNGSGNTKLRLSGQLNQNTKKALDNALNNDPNINNNDLSQALDCNGNSAPNSCTLVDDGSGNTKIKLSGGLNQNTKKAIDKALKKDPNINNNNLNQALDCDGAGNSNRAVGIGFNTSGNSLECISYRRSGNGFICQEYA